MNSTTTLTANPRLDRPQTSSLSDVASRKLVYAFIWIQFFSQSLLAVEELGSIRKVIRVMGFASSLAMLVILWNRPVRRNPFNGLAVAFLALLTLEFFHPNGNTVTARAAQIALNLAIWCPVFWCARVSGSPTFLRNVVLLSWLFSVAGATMGVLQVYYPERFSPSPENIRAILGTAGANALKITLADGQSVFRPMGLSDTPGGAAGAGSSAVVFGLAIAITESNIFLRTLAILGAAAGMFCLYICQVRSLLIMTIIGMLVYLGMMAARQRLPRAAFVLVAGSMISLVGFYWALSVGGDQTLKRLLTLTDDAPSEVYMKNRGQFVEHTIDELLPEYPLGAGLGRWGMMNGYFGDPNASEGIWVEIQMTGWLLDGGFPLVLIGYAAVLTACVVSIRIALYAHDPRIADMAALVTNINLSLLAVTFNYPVFISQSGIGFWMINGLLFASVGRAKALMKPRPASA